MLEIVFGWLIFLWIIMVVRALWKEKDQKKPLGKTWQDPDEWEM